jgi:hypothetical protein
VGGTEVTVASRSRSHDACDLLKTYAGQSMPAPSGQYSHHRAAVVFVVTVDGRVVVVVVACLAVVAVCPDFGGSELKVLFTRSR